MPVLLDYPKRLQRDPDLGYREGSMHFQEESGVYKTLRKITRRLEDEGFPYVIVGGMALFQHGYRRFTDDVDLLVTADTLKLIHAKLDGLGYVPPFQGSKHLRDTETGVKVEFLVTGGYPGDGKPKPVAFPDPRDVATTVGDFRIIALNKLIELKLASGTAEWRAKDLVDVQELIAAKDLPLELADELDPSVQASYRDLWRKAQMAKAHGEP
jgi:hypothetical protein